MSFYILIFFALIQLAGALAYIYTMWQGKTKPNRVPWFLIALAALVASGAAFNEGARWAILPGFMSGLGPGLIFLASFLIPGAYWESTKFDYLCGSISLLGLTVWLFLEYGTIALLVAIFADFLANLPLLVKAWKHPHTENSIEFISTLLAATAGLFVIENWQFAEWGFSIYLIITCAILIYAVEREKIFISTE